MQRPQHLLSRAAANRRVFFWEEPIWHGSDEFAGSEERNKSEYLEVLQEAPSLWVLRPHLSNGVDADAALGRLLTTFMRSVEVNRFVRWYYTPMALSFTSHLEAEATVYDCMDELSCFAGAPPELAARERELFEASNVVFTGGISLFEAKQRQHTNVHAFPSSIDVKHFAGARTTLNSRLPEPTDQSMIPHPRAGFYGVIDERFDIQLLAKVAELRPSVHFVLLGPVVKIDPQTLPIADNIHYLGSKSYDVLPAYLSGWDTALLPFALNDATRFISPTKTPEYLAAGKTVISTPIRDVVREYGDAGLVAIAATPEAFAAALDKALGPQDQAWAKAVNAKLATASWDTTWAAMQREIDKVLDKRNRVTEEVFVSGWKLPLQQASHTAAVSLPQMNGARLLSNTKSTPRTRRRTESFDYIVVGAGFAGSVLAERLASQSDKRVLVVDKREHIAGNAYDFYNADGILIHQYGPHIFHTNSEKVVDYLSHFTEWRPYEHRVLSSVDGKMLPVPINLDTINLLYDLSLDAEGMEAFLAERRIQPEMIRTSEDIVVSKVGRELYEKFFRNYTRKQWGLDPSELDASVAGRIPLRFDRDDRYFSDTFQAMPLKGYTAMFERMLDHKNITIRTGTSYEEASSTYPDAKIIFTGAIDEYYDFQFGALPYRSLEFRHETHDKETYQAAPVVNYPNDHAYTRITEFKYLTGQQHAKTSIVYEFPQSSGDPYYPIPRPENAALYAKYKALADRDSNVHFCGRLANYKYLNMDQVVAQALSTYRSIAEQEAPRVSALSDKRDLLPLTAQQAG